jgi:hypothetical protein
MLELQHLFWGFPDEGLHRILIAEPVATGNGIAGVFIQTVIRLDGCSGSPLGRDGVASHGVDLRNHRYVES